MYLFKTDPYDHQLEVLEISAEREAFALFMDMGTGKSKVIIDTAAYLYGQGKIDAVVISAPNGVHRNWVLNELPTHWPDELEYIAAYYTATPKKKEREQWEKTFTGSGCRWFCFNTEAASNKKGQDALRSVVKGGRVLFALDESQRFKTPGAKRTRFIVKLGEHAEYKRILSGTPITQSPLDLYAQCKFLDPTITGFSTYTAFRAHHAEIEQRRTKNNKRGFYEHIVCYKNVEELEKNIAPHCYRIKKEDCLDLPDKVFERVIVTLTPEQRRIYNQMLEDSVAVLKESISVDIPKELRHASNEELLLFYADAKVTAKNAMTRLLRLQQVVNGSVPDDEGNVTVLKNNRLDVLKDILSDVNGKVIIWARFRYDLMMIAGMLLKEYGDDCLAEFHGGVNTDDRMEGVRRFQHDAACRFFLAQQHSGGTGLTLTAAQTVIYYSNDFSLEARLQSEDRAHRIGQTNKVTYIDLVAEDSVDEKILESLAKKKEMADGFNYANAAEEIEEKPKTNFIEEVKGIDFSSDAWE